jgi:hypothetical protein
MKKHASGCRYISFERVKNKRGSKMATGEQAQTTWALWIRDLAEMLEPCLVEVKNQGGFKLCHPEPLAHGRLLHATIHWENRWAATPTLLLQPAVGSEHAWETFGRPNKWAPSVTRYPSATPGINQHNFPGQADSPAKKQQQQHQKNLNNKQWNWKLVYSGGGRGSWKCTGEWREVQGAELMKTNSKQKAGGPTAGGW